MTFMNKVGPIKAKQLLQFGITPEQIIEENSKKLSKITGIKTTIFDKMNRKEALSKAIEASKKNKKLGVRPIYFEDLEYPRRLKNCADAPLVIYQKGELDLNQSKIISMVGTRNATAYGNEICREFIKSIKDQNITVVSGLAHGIDAVVHRSCVEFNVPTIGVLGHGLDIIYPSTHRELADKMLKQGSLISEFVPGVKPDRENFPKRNRIVAGMTDATVVVESKIRGGSLITANLANDYNKDVFAFPGSVHMETSRGCNHLIASQKAHLIQNSDDFLRLIGWKKKNIESGSIQKQLFLEFTNQQKKILALIQQQSQIQLDVLSIKLALPISTLNQELFSLEMDGVIRTMPGKVYTMAQKKPQLSLRLLNILSLIIF